MSSHIDIAADISNGFSEAQLRDKLRTLDDSDLSETSPVSAGGYEAAVALDRGEGVVHLTVEGHDGTFTKTSERALLRVLRDVPGADDPRVEDGGYDG